MVGGGDLGFGVIADQTVEWWGKLLEGKVQGGDGDSKQYQLFFN